MIRVMTQSNKKKWLVSRTNYEDHTPLIMESGMLLKYSVGDMCVAAAVLNEREKGDGHIAIKTKDSLLIANMNSSTRCGKSMEHKLVIWTMNMNTHVVVLAQHFA